MKTPDGITRRECFFCGNLNAFKHEVYACVFDNRASRFDTVGLVFVDTMIVEADGKPNACFFHDILLLFVFQKLGGVIVRFKVVRAVEVYVDFPKNIMLG